MIQLDEINVQYMNQMSCEDCETTNLSHLKVTNLIAIVVVLLNHFWLYNLVFSSSSNDDFASFFFMI